MTLTEVIEAKRVYVATKGGVIVGGLQHPFYGAKDWSVYLAGTPEENERRQRIREELEQRMERYKPAVDSFLEHYRVEGHEVHIGVAHDWLTAILLNEDLCDLSRIEGLRIQNLG